MQDQNPITALLASEGTVDAEAKILCAIILYGGIRMQQLAFADLKQMYETETGLAKPMIGAVVTDWESKIPSAEFSPTIVTKMPTRIQRYILVLSFTMLSESIRRLALMRIPEEVRLARERQLGLEDRLVIKVITDVATIGLKAEENSVRAMACQVIGEIAHEQSATTLKSVIVDTNQRTVVRRQAASALGLIPGASTLDTLFTFVLNENHYIREGAREGILNYYRANRKEGVDIRTRIRTAHGKADSTIRGELTTLLNSM